MADNRENTLLQAIAEGETVDDARTSDEVFLKAIADGAEKPEEIRNRLQYWLNQIDGGGGNPNYIETIEGTLANPWGGNSSSELFTSARAGDLTMYITADVIYGDGESPYASTLMFFPVSGAPTLGFIRPSNNATSLYFARLNYTNSGSLTRAIAGNIKTSVGTQELHDIEPTTPCTLTIIHHPLPTSPPST